MPSSAPLYSIPIKDRPPHGSLLTGLLFALTFNTCIILTNLTQFILFPLSLHPATAPLYYRITKSSFGCATVLISQWFAPTSFVVTAGEGVEDSGTEWLERDSKGKVTGLKLAKRGIWISNHQTLADWLYLWSFAYFASHHGSILITLKSSLRKIPVIGWATRLYGFIFLARNWTADKVPFANQLKKVVRNLKRGGDDEKLALLVFPEGTLVTGNTRPKSLAFAEKSGVADLKHTLLPRSTGLFFALRNLAPSVPDLTLIDLTVAYPGTFNPPTSYPEDHYSLSIWFKQVPPPSIHVHVRQFSVAKDVPLGVLDGSDGTPEEKRVFEEWLRKRWEEKDQMMLQFAKEGSFAGGEKKGETAVLPVQLRCWWEYLECFSFFLPVIALVAAWYLLPALWAYGTAAGAEATVRPCCAAKASAAAAKLAAEKVASGKLEL
ncbi:acyltransferase-domain-containing protein [Leucosporidium creatinivorum]|uniref:Acyltransferase-domain-containing protein n=1 Tax=Leucosporidium creatinivorum TaxID=106004 RepID=A0A1Y2FW42_9BASI|nr:acyltransferase-domain-containing protein [Leucosporidium creatinivorum]